MHYNNSMNKTFLKHAIKVPKQNQTSYVEEKQPDYGL